MLDEAVPVPRLAVGTRPDQLTESVPLDVKGLPDTEKPVGIDRPTEVNPEPVPDGTTQLPCWFKNLVASPVDVFGAVIDALLQ